MSTKHCLQHIIPTIRSGNCESSTANAAVGLNQRLAVHINACSQ